MAHAILVKALYKTILIASIAYMDTAKLIKVSCFGEILMPE